MPLPRKDNKMRKIINEPNWENMFEIAKSIVRSQVKQQGQRDIVVSMLDFGKQTFLQRNEVIEKVKAQLPK